MDAKEVITPLSKLLKDKPVTDLSTRFIGRYCVIRCSAAGVHAGRVLAVNGSSVVISNARRLWYWKAAKSAFLSGVAKYGITKESKVGAEIPEMSVLDACEIIPCSDEAIDSIADAEEHVP